MTFGRFSIVFQRTGARWPKNSTLLIVRQFVPKWFGPVWVILKNLKNPAFGTGRVMTKSGPFKSEVSGTLSSVVHVNESTDPSSFHDFMCVVPVFPENVWIE